MDMQKLIDDILDEELKQRDQLRKEIYEGESDYEEFKDSIQMFNLHKEETLVDVTTIK